MTDQPAAATLHSAVAALDPIVALLALVHLTGDRTLLRTLGGEFDGVPRGGAQSSFNPRDTGKPKELDPAVDADIRARLIAAMESNPNPIITQPDRALFQQMADFCIGMPLKPDATAMGREQAGFSRDEGAAEAKRVPPEGFKVFVLGGGMAGLIAGIKLKAAGFDFQIAERWDAIGGTWMVNRYPHVAVDTPSVQYSLSFEQNASWTKYYPRGPEYRAYLDRVADKYQIRDKIAFNTTMTGCHWDDDRNLWTITCTQDGKEVVYEANAVVVAIGFLSRPSFPDVPGLDSFAGPVLHSGNWDDNVQIEGKKVLVVGTGATAAQLATNLGGRADHLTIVQRQPNYMMPDQKTLKEVDPDERWALEHIPFVTQWRRFQSLVSLLTLPISPAVIDPDYRARTGGVSAINEGAKQVSLRYIAEKFADRPDLKAKVTPDFPFFAKRPILDCGYYDTLKRPNVDLVEGSLARVEPDGVVLKDGTRIACDVLALATGWTLDYMSNLDIRGRGGRKLSDTWAEYPFAYKGLEVPGFPNFFVTSGPNSALTSSHTTLAEQQIHYIVETLKLMVDEEFAAVEVTQEACDAYNRDLEKRLEQTIWIQSGTAHGYYRHATGRIVLGYPGTNLEYWLALRRPVVEDHRFTSSDSDAAIEPARAVLT
ncbi:flavin-containing monooxygenase [Sphingomonas crocodyli]|nr:NAD(P)/FAD-dependent oxidoreductase [Sphingomonas crocodyli]